MPTPQSWVDLQALHSFGVAVRARWYAPVRAMEQLDALRANAELRAVPWLVLGGGSNVLFVGDYPGLVVHIDIRGVTPLGTAPDGDRELVRVGAGEPWAPLVERLVLEGRPGLENLALIPGRAGAAPVQNIGAYGLELAERLHSVTVWDAAAGGIREMSVQDCALGYRDSIFKHDGGRHVIVAVTLALPSRWEPVIGYAELARELAARAHARPGPADVMEAVCALRRRKLPDPAALGNAGSFFKNPVVGRSEHVSLMERFPSMVSYPLAGGRWKLAAGWLIEACGFKGCERGPAGVYERQALVLVNRGGASGRQILDLAREIQDCVGERFGVFLEPEVRIIGS